MRVSCPIVGRGLGVGWGAGASGSGLQFLYHRAQRIHKDIHVLLRIVQPKGEADGAGDPEAVHRRLAAVVSCGTESGGKHPCWPRSGTRVGVAQWMLPHLPALECLHAHNRSSQPPHPPGRGGHRCGRRHHGGPTGCRRPSGGSPAPQSSGWGPERWVMAEALRKHHNQARSFADFRPWEFKIKFRVFWNLSVSVVNTSSIIQKKEV